MRPHRDLETFDAELRAAVGVVLPAAHVRLVERTLVAIKLRVDLFSDRFIDVFFNGRNGRTDLSVVEGERRIFGYDNLGGWHRHPVNAPDDHEPCDEPSLEQFLVEASQLSVGPRR